MGIRPYIDDDLAAGRLVAPFALTVPKGMRWYLVYRSFQHRAARLRRIPALDHPRRGEPGRAAKEFCAKPVEGVEKSSSAPEKSQPM